MLMPLKWCGSAVPKGIITSLRLRSTSSDWPLSCNLIYRMGVRLTNCPVRLVPLANCFSLWKIFGISCKRERKKILTQTLSPLHPAELPGCLLGSPALSQHFQGPQNCLSTVQEKQTSKVAKNHEVASCSRKTCVRICEK